MIVADTPCTAAGVFTTNKVSAAAVDVAKRHLRSGTAQAIVCNSGNANAATGQTGLRNAMRMCQRVAQQAGIGKAHTGLVLPSSTGVIGRQLPMDKIERGIAALAARLTRGATVDAAVAKSILTTDLVPKHAARTIGLSRRVQLAGVCKGSGMIAPNMATLLAFITTDAAISGKMLRAALKQAVAVSFNRISVDGHTSPSDMVLVLASGAAGHAPIQQPGRDFERFSHALTALCHDLAYQIVLDAEGMTRVMRVCVRGAKSQRDADRIGKAIVDSPLVKTAVHGGDANWGRIVTAAGYSGAAIDPTALSLDVASGPAGRRNGRTSQCVLRRGQPIRDDPRTRQRLARIMTAQEVVFTLHVGLGKATTQWLGCDLSRRYVTINADYTT